MTIARIATVLMLSVMIPAGFCHGTDLRRVVLYDDQAMLDLEAGLKGTFTFEAPPDLIPESLVVTPCTGGAVRSVGMEPLRSPSGMARVLQDRLADIHASLAAARREQAMVDRQIEVIFLSAGSKDRPAPFARQQLTEALLFMDERIPPLNRRAVELARKISDLETEAKDLQNRLQGVSRDPGWLVRIAGDGPAGITYGVRSASWRPEYRVHASPDSAQLTIEVSASIRQSTGMDWNVGELLVSTGSPSHGIQAPELRPWYLQRPSPRLTKSMPESFDAAALASGAPMEDAPVEATSTSYLVGAARNVRLSGDGTPETVLLGRHSLAAAYTMISVPRLSSRAYLRAEAVMADGSPLVPGTYSSFVDGAFSGRGAMVRTEPGQKMVIDVGVVEGILIERKETRVFHEKTITGRDRTTYAYEITAENARSRKATLTLKDQVPISQDEAVEVRLLSASPEAKPDRDGVLSWELSLEPKQKRTIGFSFSITGSHVRPQ